MLRRDGRPVRHPAFGVPVAGGVATCCGADSPFTKVAGAGFADLPGESELADLEARYAEHGALVSFEVSTLAEPALVELLTARGYRLLSFENVLLRPMDRPIAAAPDDIAVRRVDDVDADRRVWLDLAVEAALHPDTDGIPQHDEFPRQVLEEAETAGADAGALHYLAEIDGQPAGAAGVRFAEGIAQLTGAGTAVAFRRRGVQKALTTARLRDALAAGCDLATVTVQPGSPSHASTQGTGFDLAYTRAVLALESTGASKRV